MGLRISGSEFAFKVLGLRVWGPEFWVQCVDSGFKGLGFGVQNFGFSVWVQGLEVRPQHTGLGDRGLGGGII